MKTVAEFKLKVGKRTYLLWIDCEVNVSDVRILKGKYIVFYCHNASINEKNSHKDYKKAFEVTPDGDFHLVIEFKKNPSDIRVLSQINFHNGPNQIIIVEGE